MPNTPLKRILVVDDEPSILGLLVTVLGENGWDVTGAGSGSEGIEKLERGQFDVILTDLMMPGDTGIDLLRASKEFRPDVEVILMTGFATADTAIEAMRNGAFHYLVKPLKLEEVLHLTEKAYTQRQLLRENQFLKAEVRAGYQLQSVVGDSEAIERVIASLQAIAATQDPVLLVGERGSGRSFFARFVHFCSPRSAGLFVPVRCAGQPEEKLAADLLGHALPAGDRSVPYRSGKIEMANHGTLFLADIDEAGRGVLDRLAMILETKTLSQGEGGREVPHDIRFIASSTLPTDELKSRGILPSRMTAMLETGTVRIPALRERKEDVPLLLVHFLEEVNQDRKKPLKGFTPAALSVLEPYDWPGNVRELVNLVRNISSKKKQGTMIDASDIPPEILYRQLRKKEPVEED
ncbi:MAG: sigma-54-dependent transcriptional response regulator [Deltaproteobacteria bacterium]|nr:sigma-54-dependent transcriptional response regulator [Deltaproteobacteria bacterium]